MRLLDLLHCGGRASPTEEATLVSFPTEHRETATRRSRPPASSSHRRKAGTKASSSSWRPSLAAISEKAAQSKVASQAPARRSDKTEAARAAKSNAGDTRRILPRSRSDEYERVSSMATAFTPTAFLF